MSIKLLPQDVINRLAAGEIIHSEVQAIKELIENSVDAGATKVDITIVNQNTFIYRDNGQGISKEDLPLLCVRFATSKLDKYEHLQCVQTLGFRGEALSSISYVAEILVETVHNNIYSKASYKDSKMLQVQHNTANEENYTKFEIKFNQLEINYLHLQRFIQSFQLLNNTVNFILNNQGETLHLNANTREQLIQEYFNIQNQPNQLHKVELEKPKFTLDIYIALPPNKYALIKQQIFVNNRYIKDIQLCNTVNTILRTYLINKKFNYILFLVVDPNDLDFNCHVQKLKVFFKYHESVINNIVEAVSKFKRDNQNILELNQKNDTQTSKITKQPKIQSTQQILDEQAVIRTQSGIKIQQYTNQKSNLQYLRMIQLNQQIDFQVQQSQATQKCIDVEQNHQNAIKFYLQYVHQAKLLSKEKLINFLKELNIHYKERYQEYKIKNIKVLNLATSKTMNNIFIQVELNLINIELKRMIEIILEHSILKSYIYMKSPFMFFNFSNCDSQFHDEEIFFGFSSQTSLTLRHFLVDFGIKQLKQQNQFQNYNSNRPDCNAKQLNLLETLQNIIQGLIWTFDVHIINKQQLINTLNNYIIENSEILNILLENSKIISQNQILSMFDRQ